MEQTENEIFQTWKSKRSNIVRDGIVNISEYKKYDEKVLFILKEANRPKGDSWDIRPFLQNGGRGTTWNNITRWVYGIRNIDKTIHWNEISKITSETRKEHLNTIAIINVKKTPGKSVSNNEEILNIANEDNALLKKQFELYKSTITICCGQTTYEILKQFLSHEFQWKKTTRGIPFLKANDGKVFIAYYHPAIRVDSCLLFYGLFDAIKEIKTNHS